VTASVTGVAAPATFNLSNTAGPAQSIVTLSGTPQSATVATTFGSALQAKVTDAFANPVSGVAVTFAAPNEWHERDIRRCKLGDGQHE
jgi:adhesin/invasin